MISGLFMPLQNGSFHNAFAHLRHYQVNNSHFSFFELEFYVPATDCVGHQISTVPTDIRDLSSSSRCDKSNRFPSNRSSTRIVILDKFSQHVQCRVSGLFNIADSVEPKSESLCLNFSVVADGYPYGANGFVFRASIRSHNPGSSHGIVCL